jgi:hypothetical protein
MCNEWDNVLPWVSHHLQQGFGPLLISDNESEDGTLELLEALAEVGYVRLHRQPGRRGGIQLAAYAALQELLAGDAAIIGFVDADEFVVSHDGELAAAHLLRLFDSPSVGAVAVNWRVFGSAGRRFCGRDRSPSSECAPPWHRKHHYFKSFGRVQAQVSVGAHEWSLSPGFDYVHVDGTNASQFCQSEAQINGPFGSEPTGLTARVVMSPVTIHHRILGDHTTFQLGKASRKRADVGVIQDGWQGGYFSTHDLNSDSCTAEQPSLDDRMALQSRIFMDLINGTNLVKKFVVRVHQDQHDNHVLTVDAPEGVNRTVHIEVLGEATGESRTIEIPVSALDDGFSCVLDEFSEDRNLQVRVKGVLHVEYR